MATTQLGSGLQQQGGLGKQQVSGKQDVCICIKHATNTKNKDAITSLRDDLRSRVPGIDIKLEPVPNMEDVVDIKVERAGGQVLTTEKIPIDRLVSELQPTKERISKKITDELNKAGIKPESEIGGSDWRKVGGVGSGLQQQSGLGQQDACICIKHATNTKNKDVITSLRDDLRSRVPGVDIKLEPVPNMEDVIDIKVERAGGQVLCTEKIPIDRLVSELQPTKERISKKITDELAKAGIKPESGMGSNW